MQDEKIAAITERYSVRLNQQQALLKQMAEALERLVFLHTCEQEGMSSGMPTFEDWIQAVNSAEQALAAYKGRG